MIAISYRREDSLPVAGRLYDRLQAEFGKGNVFMDFDSIPYGVDFREHIKHMIEHSKVLVAMIGPDWIGRRRHGNRRIDDPADFVRLEIAYALERNLPVIPILISNTRMPRVEELPKDIEGLVFRNALSLDSGIDFHHHAERLVTAINRILTIPPPPIVSVQKEPSAEITIGPTPLAPPETQLTSKAIPTTPANIPKSLPVKPPSVESNKQRSPPIRTDGVGGSAAEAMGSAAQARPTITQKPKGPTLVVRSTAVWRGARVKASAAVLRVGRLLTSMNISMRRRMQAAIEFLHGHRKAETIVLSFVGLIMLISAAGMLYWSLRSDSLRHWLFISKNLVKKGLSEPRQPPAIANRSSEHPGSAPASPSESPLSAPVPAPPRGVLTINSSPQGQAFEVIAADGNHRSGTTPMTLEDLPIGYAQVIFKRNGFLDHSQAVWLNPSASVTWNLRDDTRIPEPTQPDQQVTPPASQMNASAQNGRTWQAWIGDFVRKFISADELQDMDTSLAFYAPSVDYFDAGQQDIAYIRQDVGGYNQRWPVRHASVDGEVHVSEKAPGKEYGANYKVNFYAESTGHEWSRGKSSVHLDITVIDGVPRISRIKQTFIQRHKGKLGAPVSNQAAGTKYPYGISVQGKPGFVRSPYAPAKGEIDIRRYRKGSEIKCPFTGKTFIAP
jgi:hypothetical protein